MPSGNTVKHGWILLCMCTPLYNETLRACFTVRYDKKFKNFSKYVKKARQNKYFNNLQNQKILLILQGHYIILLLLPVKRHCINGTEVKGTGRSGM